MIWKHSSLLLRTPQKVKNVSEGLRFLPGNYMLLWPIEISGRSTFFKNEAIMIDKSSLRWTYHDTTWVLTLFGTAIGAGVLFLPINAGLSGFWPMVALALLAAPMTYFSHRALCRFVLSSDKAGSDITVVATDSFGHTLGSIITFIYFLSIFPIVLVYGVTITDIVGGMLVTFGSITPPPRWILSGIILFLMIAVVYGGQKIILSVTSWLVYPLVIILALIAFRLIPFWNTEMITAPLQSVKDISVTMWITLPVIVFAFNHAPVISYFSLSQRNEHGSQARPKADQIILYTAIMLWVFVMFFVFSCVLSLSPEELQKAKDGGTDILTFIAIYHAKEPLIRYAGPIIAFTAVASSFFGHYLGTVEGLSGFICKISPTCKPKSLKWPIAIFMFASTWVTAILAPKALNVIESFSGPIIAVILFIMPMYAIHKLPALAPYRGKLSNIFIVIMGSLAISAAVYGLIK